MLTTAIRIIPKIKFNMTQQFLILKVIKKFVILCKALIIKVICNGLALQFDFHVLNSTLYSHFFLLVDHLCINMFYDSLLFIIFNFKFKFYSPLFILSSLQWIRRSILFLSGSILNLNQVKNVNKLAIIVDDDFQNHDVCMKSKKIQRLNMIKKRIKCALIFFLYKLRIGFQ